MAKSRSSSRGSIIAVFLAIIVILGVAGYFFLKSGIMPLGFDAVSIITAAENLQKKSDFVIEYNISATQTLEATKSAQYRRVERKLGSFVRVDSFLTDATLVTRYIVNSQGSFLCSFLEGETAQCYDLTEKLNKTDQDMDVFKNWQKSGVVTAKISSKNIRISGKERTCDQLETTLEGKNLTEAMIAEITKLMPDKPTQDDMTKSKGLLDEMKVTTSNCYDRETGLPLITERITSIGDQQMVSSQVATAISRDLQTIDKLKQNTIVTSETETFKLLRNPIIDGDTLYFVGEKGIITIKDGKLVSRDEEVSRKFGDVRAITKFQGNMYMGANFGLFRQVDGKWKRELDMVKTFAGQKFIIVGNTLYAGTGNGVFVLQKDVWTQPNASFKDMGTIHQFADVGGKFYALTRKGVYLYEADKWSEVLSIPDYGDRKLYADGDHLFVSTNSKTLEIKNKQSELITDYKTTGDVNDVIFYKGDVFVAGNKGIYSSNEKLRASDKTVSYAKDFLIFQDGLYAATDAGIYKLTDQGWVSVNSEDIGSINKLFNKDGSLYAGGIMGTYRFDGTSWIEVAVTDVNNFYQVGNRLYVTSSSETFLKEIIEERGDPKKLFDLPVDAKVIKL